jgi:hypothetical protein
LNSGLGWERAAGSEVVLQCFGNLASACRRLASKRHSSNLSETILSTKPMGVAGGDKGTAGRCLKRQLAVDAAGKGAKGRGRHERAWMQPANCTRGCSREPDGVGHARKKGQRREQRGREWKAKPLAGGRQTMMRPMVTLRDGGASPWRGRGVETMVSRAPNRSPGGLTLRGRLKSCYGAVARTRSP